MPLLWWVEWFQYYHLASYCILPATFLIFLVIGKWSHTHIFIIETAVTPSPWSKLLQNIELAIIIIT